MTKTIEICLKQAQNELSDVSGSLSSLESRILLEYVLNKPISYILANSEDKLNQKEYEQFIDLVKRRRNLEPIAYIIGKKEFYSREFIVNKNVLIPRPDTEILIDTTINLYSKDHNPNAYILDLGTGSGCIIISLLLELPDVIGIGIDISDQALKIAKQNAFNHNVLNRLQLMQSNWFESLSIYNHKPFDLIVSNPPYIDQQDLKIMSQETMLHEPNIALYSENNGLAAYKNIAKNAVNYLKDTGKIILEIGINQTKPVTEIFQNHDYNLLEISKDLNGKERVLVFKKNILIKHIKYSNFI